MLLTIHFFVLRKIPFIIVTIPYVNLQLENLAENKRLNHYNVANGSTHFFENG